MRKVFRSTVRGSRVASQASDVCHDHDEVFQVLKELSLDKYYLNFKEMKVIYSEIPFLTKEQLVKLIPDEIPLQRFEIFISKNFISWEKKKVGEEWEIDSGKIKTKAKEKEIGSGGFGSIRTGEIDVGTGTITVALKKIKIDGKLTTKEKVINEAKIMSLCHHPNVLKSFGCYFSDDERTATLCLEYLPEGDLLEFTEKFHIPIVQKLGYLIDIARGVRYLHKKNIIHRDIKPANILIFHDRKSAKICDFGMSKLDSQIGKTLCGTPEYIAPEQFHGMEVKNAKKIDVYAFGILMWEVFCDTNPYKHLHKKYPNNTLQIMRVIHDEKKPIRPNLGNKMLKGLDSDILDLMETCWEVDPEDRPTISEVLDELRMNMVDMKGGEVDSSEDEEEEEDDDNKI